MSDNLPVIKKIMQMKKNWGNEYTAPEYSIHDEVYKSIEESCMMLNHNKNVFDDVYYEMTENYKGKVNDMIKQSKNE